MSVDAIALLPAARSPSGEAQGGGWVDGEGPGGGRGLWRPLRDGTLLNLGLPFQAPDDVLYEGARHWLGAPPARVWVFPDTEVPDENTSAAVAAATREVGRWVQAGPRRRSVLEELGFTPEEEEAFQRDMRSADAGRVRAALARIEERLRGRDPAEVEAVLAKLLGRG